MNRRDAIARVGFLVGGTVVGAEVFLSGCAPASRGTGTALDFSPEMIAVLDEIGDSILPTTEKSPGAKAAEVGKFMQDIVTMCYSDEDQATFATAVPTIEEAARATFDKGFMSLTAQERHDLIVQIDLDAKEYDRNRSDGSPRHGFSLLKQLTLWGYFTSEVGSKQALRYEPLPGRYEGCIDYEEGDRAWAAT